MNSLAEALNKANIKATDFDAVEVDEKEIEANAEIAFWEKLLKLYERNASKKELHLFATENGFLSELHLKMYAQVKSNADELQFEINLGTYEHTPRTQREEQEKLEQLKSMVDNIKRPSYYKLVMRKLGQRDISPYGEDVLKGSMFY